MSEATSKYEHENKNEDAPGFIDLEAYCLRCDEAVKHPFERAHDESHGSTQVVDGIFRTG